MRLSVFSGAEDNVPKPLECDWAWFAENLGPHDYTFTDKLKTRAFSPAEYPDNSTRLAKNVVRLWMFVGDHDHLTEEQALGVIDRIVEFGLRAIVYTSWSHAADPWRIRSVIALTRPVLREEWAAFWPRVNALFDGLCDKKCIDPSRLYFGPFAPAGTESSNFYEVFDGEPLDVDAVLSTPFSGPTPSAEPQRDEPTQKLSREELHLYARSLKRKQNDHVQRIGDLLLKVFRGEPFAEPGSRDNVIFDLARYLGERFVDHDADSIASHFGASIAIMQQTSGDCPTVDDVAYKIRRRQDEVRERREKQEHAQVDEHESRVHQAFQNGRSHDYTTEELAAFGDMQHKWIVQYGSSYYFFVNGTYFGPRTEKEAQNCAAIYLAPARSAGIGLYTLDAKGNQIFKNLKTLVDQYGTVAETVELDLRAQVTEFDSHSRVLTEACCPIRKITPKFNAEVHMWLHLLAGDEKFHDLCTWLSEATSLERTLAALFITGVKGTGKSLIIQGVSRIWSTRGPTQLEDCFASFNSALVNCPLTIADEQLPKDFRGYAKNSELRLHITQTERPLRRKHIPDTKILGATRTIVVANSESILATGEDLSEDDVSAIADRYVWIRANVEAREYLKSIDTTGWVNKDIIAAHVLWLRDNYEHVLSDRFGFGQSTDMSLHRSLTTRSGVKSLLCQWHVGYLLDPARFHRDARSNLHVRIYQGELLSNVQGPMQCWGQYIENEKCPPVSKLSAALGALSQTERRPKLKDLTGKYVNYHIVNMENLYAWAESNGFGDRERLEEALARDTEESEKIHLPYGSVSDTSASS